MSSLLFSPQPQPQPAPEPVANSAAQSAIAAELLSAREEISRLRTELKSLQTLQLNQNPNTAAAALPVHRSDSDSFYHLTSEFVCREFGFSWAGVIILEPNQITLAGDSGAMPNSNARHKQQQQSKSIPSHSHSHSHSQSHSSSAADVSDADSPQFLSMKLFSHFRAFQRPHFVRVLDAAAIAKFPISFSGLFGFIPLFTSFGAPLGALQFLSAADSPDFATSSFSSAQSISIQLFGRLISRRAELAAESRSGDIVKSRFLANISHELRTPLHGILGSCDLLSRTNLESGQKELLADARGQARALLHSLNAILDFTQIESAKIDLEPREFELFNFLQRVICESEDRNSLSQTPRVAVSLMSSLPNPLLIRCDPVRLRQILLILLSNSLKFSPTDAAVLLAVQRTSEEFFEFTVSDGGIGIEPENFMKIFQPFVQEDDGIARMFSGSGIGLAISKRVANLMGGGIEVISSKGSGAMFRLKVRVSVPNNQLIQSFDIPKLIPRVESAADELEFSDSSDEFNSCNSSVLSVAGQGIPDYCSVSRTLSTDHSLRQDSVSPPPADVAEAELFRSSRRSEIRSRNDSNEQKPMSDGSSPPSTLRILLVDDNPINLKVASRMLEMDGHECVKCEGGVQALELLAEKGKKAFDLLLMDCSMPVVDGFEATRRIRHWESQPQPNDSALKVETGQISSSWVNSELSPSTADSASLSTVNRRQRIPIVALTASATVEDRNLCIRSGMDSVLTKPFSKAQMKKLIRGILHSKRRAE